ncbi:MAG TPA: SIMPL domain-containing protein [Nocardioides sp.]|nr:SIMPL domain-containing protein [Nocardioides sp.]
MSTEITVRGSFTAFHRPERGTAHVTIGFEGPDPQPVYERVVRELESVKTSVQALHDPGHGPVTWWSTQHVRTWANRPWNKDGVQLPLVHHASVGVEVKFSDFAALSQWVGRHAKETPGFSLSRVAWALTEGRRKELERTVRTRAVQDAARRAQEYADALGLGPVAPVAIADAGMLGEGLDPSTGGGEYLRAGAAPPSGGGELELLPEDIEVTTSVDARFVVDAVGAGSAAGSGGSTTG